MVGRGVGYGLYDETVRAVAGRDNLTFLGALEHALKRIHVEPRLGPVAAVAFDAGSIKKGLHIGVVGDAGFG